MLYTRYTLYYYHGRDGGLVLAGLLGGRHQAQLLHPGQHIAAQPLVSWNNVNLSIYLFIYRYHM